MTDTKHNRIIDQIIGRLAFPVVPLQLLSPHRAFTSFYIH